MTVLSTLLGTTYSGVQGTQGTYGTQGAQGTQGIQGIQGISGAASTLINATNDGSTTALYPIMVGATGSNQTVKASTGNIVLNGSTGALTLSGDIDIHNSTNEMHIFLGSSSGYFYGSSTAAGWYKTTGGHISWNVSTGDFTSNGNITAYSDPKLKENITVIESALDKIKQLQGIKFRWKNKSFLGHSGEYDYGVLSTDVSKIAPELVSEYNNEDGTYQTVVYDKLIAFAIEAIKEQQYIIESQANKISNLEENISSLNDKMNLILHHME